MTTWQRLWRRLDPGFLIVVAICLLAVWPFVSRDSLPEGTDAELHIFRLAELSYLVRGGEFYPRWAPNFYHGYGYPIFNYYAPLTYYLGLPLELLPGVDAVLAVKTLFVVGLLLAGLGMYGFVRDNWGRRAGYVAAALYVYAPYVQTIDPHIRGVLPESFSFALFPLALWALDRLRRRPSVGSWLAAAGSTAAVILSHNLMGLFFFGQLLAWVVWQGVIGRLPKPDDPAEGHGRALWPALALMLGLGAAAFYWLPVILERDAVSLTTLIGDGGNYDFRNHFLSLTEMLAPSLRPDWGATQSPFRFNLGLAQWLLGGLGVVLLIFNRVRQRAHVAFFGLALTAILFLMLPVSQAVWEAVPFLPYFQFPWRLLGAVAAMLAVLGGAGIDGLARLLTPGPVAERPAWLAAAAVALTLLLALPLSQPPPWDDFGEVNTLRMSLIENSGRWLGTTSTADYVPATVEMLPERRGSVVANFELGLPPDRVNREAMPDGAVVETETVRPLLTRYHIRAPKQFRLRLYQFDFPGWRVTVDGEPAQTELAQPEGFIVVLVPEGEHVVEVRFGSTPARTTGWIIAAISMGVVVVLAWPVARRHRANALAPVGAFVSGLAAVRPDWPVPAVALAIGLLAILLQPVGLFHRASEGNDLDVAASKHYVNFGDQIALLGFTADEAARPGEAITVDLYWQALRDLDVDYQAFVHVLDGQGNLVAQSDKLNPGEFPTRRWPLDKYVFDSHEVTLPADLPLGEYVLTTGLWVQSEGWRLPVFDELGNQVGDHTPLATLEVR